MYHWPRTSGSKPAASTPVRAAASRQLHLQVYLGKPCNPRCQRAFDRLTCPKRGCRLALDTDALTCSTPSRGCCWLLQQPEELYDLALELSRSRDYIRARTAFEVLLQSKPTLCKAWVSYAQVSIRWKLGCSRRPHIAACGHRRFERHASHGAQLKALTSMQ